jgi:hypothetical protein
VVAIVGYSVNEFFFMTVLTYLLLVLLGFIRVIRVIASSDETKKIIVEIGLLVVLVLLTTGIYYFPVRIGFVMFVNGILVSLIFMCAWNVVRLLFPVEVKVSQEVADGAADSL